MFDRIRRPGRSLKESSFKKLFSYFVFGLICVIFVFLVPMGSQLLGEGILAYVGPEAVRAGEVQFFEANLKSQYRDRLKRADEEAFSKIQEEIRQRALSEVIKMYLVVQGSQKAGFFIGDKELKSILLSIPIFKEKGRFLYSKYKLYLKSQNLKASRFENRIRKIQQAKEWDSLFRKAIVKSQLERKKDRQRQAYKVNFQYVALKAGDVKEEKLEPLLKSKDLPKINQFLIEQKKQWKKTGEFSLLSPFGVEIAQNQNLMEALIRHLPNRGLIPVFIRHLDQVYIVNVLSFQEKKLSLQERQIQDLLSRSFGKSTRVLNSWTERQYQLIKVKRSSNPL